MKSGPHAMLCANSGLIISRPFPLFVDDYVNKRCLTPLSPDEPITKGYVSTMSTRTHVLLQSQMFAFAFLVWFLWATSNSSKEIEPSIPSLVLTGSFNPSSRDDHDMTHWRVLVYTHKHSLFSLMRLTRPSTKPHRNRNFRTRLPLPTFGF